MVAGVTAATDTLPWAAYRPGGGPPRDEAIDPQGAWRPHVAAALAGVDRPDLRALSEAIADDVRRAGLRFPIDGGTEAFLVDPIPRVLTAQEWATIEAGVAQRARALAAFVAAPHARRRPVAEGAIRGRVIPAAEHFEPAAGGYAPPAGVWVAV